ncbi:MarR family winged helix-turn-helix transcriptional regulator [Sphingomonas morindae]|uniref:MarR family winged helix-turn-helix transcriptional regulator n=1 Tax=Sphingomonas morindae TaxID=1541170 RepID=UPI003F5D4FCD
MARALRLQHFLPYRLSIASNQVSGLVAEAYDRLFGLSIPEWRVVTVLAEAAPLSQLDIVGRTLMDKMTVSRAVRPLVARGLLDRETHKGDRRAQHLRLSTAGRSLYECVAPQALAMEAALLEGFTAAEVAALESALDRLRARAAALSRDAGQSVGVDAGAAAAAGDGAVAAMGRPAGGVPGSSSAAVSIRSSAPRPAR